jgi:hypothetical protein
MDAPSSLWRRLARAEHDGVATIDLVDPVEMSMEPSFVRDLPDAVLRRLWRLSASGVAAGQVGRVPGGASDDALGKQAASLGYELIRRGLI